MRQIRALPTSSQNGEHLFISTLFEKIGFRSNKFVEIGAWPVENNCCQLAIQENFEGLYVDPSFNNDFGIYNNSKISWSNEFVNISNVNQVISSKFSGEIDLLSIDVDGVDLYLLDAINVVEPRVLCIEYNASLGPSKALTVAYRDDFDRANGPHSWYCGGSLLATIRIAKRLGYKFVGQVFGLNAFFVKAEEDVREVSIKDVWEPHGSRIKYSSEEEQYSELINLDWCEVNKDGLFKSKK